MGISSLGSSPPAFSCSATLAARESLLLAATTRLLVLMMITNATRACFPKSPFATTGTVLLWRITSRGNATILSE